MKHDDAIKIAEGLIEILRPACPRIEIAGSLRRRNIEVKDIEILAIPDLTPLPPIKPVFGQPIPNALGRTKLDDIFLDWVINRQVSLVKNGPKYKQFWVLHRDNKLVKVDLFLVTPPAQWGVQMVIRTGPNKRDNNFSQWVVTQKKFGGAMPDGYRSVGGLVIADEDSGDGLPMPEEMDFLNFLGLGWIEPGDRRAKWKNLTS